MDNVEFNKIIQRHESDCEKVISKIDIKGEWNNETHRAEFKAHGLDCLVLRNSSLLHWCGYVGLPTSHPDYRKSHDGIDGDCHGGLTYSGGGDLINKKDSYDLKWFGFDCMHSGDFGPGMYVPLGKDALIKGDVYRNQAYVIKEVKELAKQFKGRG